MQRADLTWLISRPIAHRGYHDLNRTRWENTLSAFQAAIEHDFAIECDVHMAADGVPVVFHDRNLKRLTGEDGEIWQRSSAELARMKVGVTEDHPPTLAELLELVAGKVPLVIELKGIEGKDDGLVTAVAGLLRNYKGDAAIMSFDHWLIRQYGEHASGVSCGLTAHGTTTADIEGHFAMLAHPISFVSFGVNDLPNPFVEFVRSRLTMPVITWTVRDDQARETTRRFADQMTFEGFNPGKLAAM